MIDSRIEKIRAEIESYKSAAEIFLKGKDDLELWLTQRDLCKKFLSFIDSLQEPATSVWHDANEAPVGTGKFLWVIVSFKDGDIHTCSVSTLVKWQNVQLDAIDCWAYREDLLNIK